MLNVITPSVIILIVVLPRVVKPIVACPLVMHSVIMQSVVMVSVVGPLYSTSIRLNQLPYSAARLQYVIPDMFYNFYFKKNKNKMLITQQPLKL